MYSATKWFNSNSSPDLFLFSGSSVHIWHDQRASTRSLSFRHAVSHIKFNSEYFLLTGTLTSTYTLHKTWLIVWHIQKLSDCGCVYFAGRTGGNDHWSSVDSVGGDWRPDLPTTRWKDKSPPTQHCGLQQHNGPKLHNDSSLDQPSDSDPTPKVSHSQSLSTYVLDNVA